LPGASQPPKADEETGKAKAAGEPKEKIYDHQMVRTDSKDQKLDKFLVRSSSQDSTLKEVENINKENSIQQENVERREIQLTSILELGEDIVKNGHSTLREAISNHSFVGCISPELALIQHSTHLYLANTCSLSEELFYQLFVINFGNFGLLKLSCSANIKELVLIALEQEESGWSEEDGPKEDLADFVLDLFQSKAPMLEDYFSLQVDESGNLMTLPYVLGRKWCKVISYE
ncbi:UNVERIFIED_CONTAM: hypothetical protein GTU68_038901, partial [Idotea baltica]|nr:hypothetical protein [Idotea baltica]